jgi:hypothetical protein
MSESAQLAERLETAVAAASTRSRRATAEAAFRAGVEARLKNVEAELGDLKGRLNGLYFVIASTLLAEVVLKVVG